METTKEDLQKKYRNLSDDKIIEIYQSGELTDIALSVLKDELSQREITADKIKTLEKEKQKEKERQFEKATLPKAPKVWIGFIFALGFLISKFVELEMGIEGRFGPFTTPISMTGMFYWLFCVQRFHQILNALTIDGYSISPGKSVGFHFIPFFNLYWMFKWPYELSKYINGLGKVKMIPGVSLGIMFFFSIIFNRIDASIGLACFFGVSSYINRKLKKQIEYGKIIQSSFLKRDYEKAWDDVHKAQNLGDNVHPEFLKDLSKASGRVDSQSKEPRNILQCDNCIFTCDLEDFNSSQLFCPECGSRLNLEIH